MQTVAAATMVLSLTILLSSIPQSLAISPSESNLTAVMSAHGCRVFAETLLLSTGGDQNYFEASVGNGLSIFCPPDAAMKAVLRLPKYKNFSVTEKGYLLQYHAITSYKTMQGLRSSNGETRTLASSNEYRYAINVKNQGNVVALKNKLMTARIISTIINKDPLAIYRINKVLMPTELFKSKGGSLQSKVET